MTFPGVECFDLLPLSLNLSEGRIKLMHDALT